MRGYGGSDKPHAIEAYDMVQMTDDVVGLIDALGEAQAIVIGHDWGAPIVWTTALRYPARIRAVVGMSVPHLGRGAQPAIEVFKQVYKDRFFYQLYFQEPGVAEKEFDADPRAILSRLYLSPDSPREKPEITDPKRAAGGWIPRLADVIVEMRHRSRRLYGRVARPDVLVRSAI